MLQSSENSEASAGRPPDVATITREEGGGDENRLNDYAPKGGYLGVERLRRQYLDYLGVKEPEIEEQKNARRYYHGAQWSAEAIKILRARRQPVITYNRVGRKINGIVGLVERLRQDPKAFPRNPRNDGGAEVATQSIRSVLDACQWQMTSSEVSRHGGIDGFSGVELKLCEGDHKDPDVTLDFVFGDDFFYDPRSRRYDFGDCRYMGIAKWVDEDEAIELFPDREEQITGLLEYGSDLTTNADSEIKWVMVNERKLRLVEHWYKKGGEWCWAFYVGAEILDEGVSPFVNSRNKTFPRFIMFSAAVDQDGDRYGFVRNMQGPQDEINQRRSKALHISNSRRLIMDKGAVSDVETARREWARPDGVIEKNPGKEIKPDDTQADLAAQFQFLQEAKQEIETIANVTPTTGQGDVPKNLSGRAINLLQQGATAELGPFVLAYRDWKLRVYRAIWDAISHYWTEERWIRVNDDQGLEQFIQLNGVGTDEHGFPAIVNAVGALDTEILLDEGPDVINMMADTFDILSGMVQSGAQIPIEILIEIAPLQSSVKRKLLGMLEQKGADPAAVKAKVLALAKAHAEVENIGAQTAERRTNALRHVASAAHAASEAHVNTNEMVREGLGLVAPEEAAAAQGQGDGSAPSVALGQEPPFPGARMAPDGHFYVPHPTQPGRHFRVVA